MNIFIIGFIFISVLGSVLHFTYELSDHNKYVALFSAVNESTWEHIKIALTPYFLYSLVDGYYYLNMNNYFPSKLVGLLVIIITIPLLFYGYQIFTKKSILFVDIMIFYVAISLSQILSYQVLFMKELPYLIKYISIIIIFIIFSIYLLFTLFPLKIEIFKDPITKKYGIKGHSHKK